MNDKKKIRLRVINTMVAISFVFAIVFTFIDIDISFLLLMFSFITALLSIGLKYFWTKMKYLKRNRP
jgi:purine-cytosine permease-like protein